MAAPGGGSGKPVTFSPGSPPVCSVSGGTVTSNTAGSCVVDANQAVSAQYQAPAHCSGRTERHGPVSPTRHRPSGAGTGCPIGSKGESIRDPDATSACQSPNSSASGRGTADQSDEDSSCVRQTGQMARTTTPPKPPRYGTHLRIAMAHSDVRDRIIGTQPECDTTRRPVNCLTIIR